MAAIDLLFDHKPNNERVHQVALSGLLLHTRLLERILGVPGLRAIELEWEPERRLYDLAFTVTEPSGAVERIFVELKIDGALDKEQLTASTPMSKRPRRADSCIWSWGCRKLPSPTSGWHSGRGQRLLRRTAMFDLGNCTRQ